MSCSWNIESDLTQWFFGSEWWWLHLERIGLSLTNKRFYTRRLINRSSCLDCNRTTSFLQWGDCIFASMTSSLGIGCYLWCITLWPHWLGWVLHYCRCIGGWQILDHRPSSETWRLWKNWIILWWDVVHGKTWSRYMVLWSYIIRTWDAIVSSCFIFVNSQYLWCYQTYAPPNATLGSDCQAVYMQGWTLLLYQHLSRDHNWFIPHLGFRRPDY